MRLPVGFLVVDFLFLVLFGLGRSAGKGVGGQIEAVAEEGVVGQVGGCLIGFGDDLEVGTDFVFGVGVELVLDDAQQPFIELKQSVDFGLVTLSRFLQFLQLVLARSLGFLQAFILSPQLIQIH